MASQKISCVICVYNEAERIRVILDAAVGHPLISQVIVVDDGSVDGTADTVREYPSALLISYKTNRGKTYALGKGISAAEEELVMLLDADLAGLTAADLTALAEPVISGCADAALSLRRNSLGIYRALGIDFVTGERVLPRALLKECADAFATLPRWGAEVYMNERIIRDRLRLAVVDWRNVYNVRKYKKIGVIRGFLAEAGMVRDALSVMPLPQSARQVMQLLRLKAKPAAASNVQAVARA